MLKHFVISALTIMATTILVLVGCATKRYVKQQTNAINQRMSEFETKTRERMTYLRAKEQNDNSQMREQIKNADARIADITTAAQKAIATALQGAESVQSNTRLITTNAVGLADLAKGVNYTLIENSDIAFDFNKSTLDQAAKKALDMIILKAQKAPGGVFEVVGFADKTGSVEYNLALSRRRAEAVERYLVRNDVPLRAVCIIGLGEEQPPAGLAAAVLLLDSGASVREARRAARRVLVRLYSTGGAPGEAARSVEDKE
jgi:outer membrane protein OmpA-like peptidoglycan-associated protein